MPIVATEARSTTVEKRRASVFSLGYSSLQPLAAVSEAIVVLAAGLVSPFLYHGVILPTDHWATVDFVGVAVMATLTFVTLSYLTGSYQPQARIARRHGIMSAMKIWAATLGFLALCAFLLKVGGEFSRATVLIYALSGALAISGLRAVWPDIVRKAVEHNLVFVTNVLVLRVYRHALPQDGVDVSRAEELRASGLQPVAWHSVSMTSGEAQLARMIEVVEAKMHSRRLHEIVILMDRDALADLDTVVERLRVFPLPVRFVLDTVTRDIMGRNLSRAGSLVLAEYQRAPLSVAERAVKRTLDLSLSLAGLILLSPIFALTALAIKLDSPGPLLFRQSRRGFGGRTFMILKFRSMTVAENGGVVVQAKKNDARVTRVGRVIRRTSLDELPQLWNIFAGEMSIVGPRPHAVAHDDYYSRFIEEYAFRHHAKPGLTGWAQVKGLRGETPKIENMQARIEKDLWYINNWSIWLDVSIIMRTMIVVLRQKTAY